ncbi:MAG: single-stranded-DNA-specific exonuclease RecJ [Venatoribacter sp.]
MLITERQLPTDFPSLPVHPILARIYASRGVKHEQELELTLKHLIPWNQLKDIDKAVALLLPIVQQGKKLLIVGDFDVDGATSTALTIRALRALGATQVSYLVPNRFDYGYGLSPELAQVALQQAPDLIMTVDNGIASHAGIELAKRSGVPVLVTDHHLPAATLPSAAAIVNPNQPDCRFPSKAACGCTVAFYVMLALRAKLVELNALPEPAPNFAELLDLVALATVADVVPLDRNNRILVEQGLRRIRSGHGHAGINALIEVAGRQASKLVAADFGFGLGPRINAAGRLDDMSLGIECLLTDNFEQARQLAQELDEMNRSRREIEQGMQLEAQRYLDKLSLQNNHPHGLVLYQHDWHQGVIGILASRVKEQAHRPVVVLADGEDGLIKGSARSIPGFHLRDALAELDSAAPHLITKFGGHAMAAGLSLERGSIDEFRKLFEQICAAHLTPAQLQQRVETDGSLSSQDFTLDLAQQLRMAGPWGQTFPEPSFVGDFLVLEQRLLKERHLKMWLKPLGTEQVLEAIWFGINLKEWPDPQVKQVKLAYQLDVNEFRGEQNIQLMVRAVLKLA